jgi:hypothetical protein
VEVQRELVTLTIDGTVVAQKPTSFDGSVTFTVLIGRDVFRAGEVPMVLEFSGTELYEGARFETTIVIEVQAIISIDEVMVNGRPFDNATGIVERLDEFRCRILVREDNGEPFAHTNVSVYYQDEGPRSTRHHIRSGPTSSQGVFEFQWSFLDYNSGNRTLIVECDELLHSASVYMFRYFAPSPIAPGEPVIRVVGTRWVAPGSTMELDIRPSEPDHWDVAHLTCTLVSPPEGMEITPDGTLTWTPTAAQVGEHTITVWLHDGKLSDSDTFTVTVAEEASDLGEGYRSLFMILGVLAVVALLVVVAIARSRKGTQAP